MSWSVWSRLRKRAKPEKTFGQFPLSPRVRTFRAMRSIFHFHARRPLTALVSSPIAHSRRYISQKLSDPLRILFCGSDDFSIPSLRALYDEHTKNRDFIASIDVVCRPPKRVGRGLKQFRSGRETRLNTNQFAMRLTLCQYPSQVPHGSSGFPFTR